MTTFPEATPITGVDGYEGSEVLVQRVSSGTYLVEAYHPDWGRLASTTVSKSLFNDAVTVNWMTHGGVEVGRAIIFNIVMRRAIELAQTLEREG